LSYARAIAAKGWQRACEDDPGLAAGLNVVEGRIAHAAVEEALRTGA
jgi:alanine dehydrogenase